MIFEDRIFHFLFAFFAVAFIPASIILARKTVKVTEKFYDFLILDNIPDTYIARSSIHGRGLFARRNFKKGEVIAVLDGMVIPENVYYQIKNSFCYLPQELIDYFFIEWTAIKEGVFLVRPLRTKYSFINHSRNPNLEIDFSTMEIRTLREIKTGEELTLDYLKEKLSENYQRTQGLNYL